MEGFLSLGVVAFSVAAAVFWSLAAFVWVNAATTNKPDKDGWYPAQISSNGVDVVMTAQRQTFWNRFAAVAACLAAACQAFHAYWFGM